VWNELLDVFEELLGLLPTRFEFSLDIILGTTPISKAPYRMHLSWQY